MTEKQSGQRFYAIHYRDAIRQGVDIHEFLSREDREAWLLQSGIGCEIATSEAAWYKAFTEGKNLRIYYHASDGTSTEVRALSTPELPKPPSPMPPAPPAPPPPPYANPPERRDTHHDITPIMARADAHAPQYQPTDGWLDFLSFAFTGSRDLPPGDDAVTIQVCANEASIYGERVLVGDAPGADSFVRQAVGDAQVFEIVGPRHAVNLVERSVRMVRAIAACPRPVIVGFPNCRCPDRVKPNADSFRCFNGGGSGTWATIAHAIGLGVPARVWLPADVLPPFNWGLWVFVASGMFQAYWSFHPNPEPAQRDLFSQEVN